MTPPTLPPSAYATHARLAKWTVSTRLVDMTSEVTMG